MTYLFIGLLLIAMRLREYLEKTGIKPSRFAKQVGMSPINVFRYMDGLKKPSCETIVKIERATSGLVRAEDFINIPSET